MLASLMRRIVFRHEPRTASALFFQQFFDALFHDDLAAVVVPVEFAVMPVANVPLLVDEVDAGPHRIAPRVPVRLVVVDDDRKFQVILFGLLSHAVFFSFS